MWLLPVVPFTTRVVTVGLDPGETSLTPLMGRVLRMVPGVPGAPFSTTCRGFHHTGVGLYKRTVYVE